jgi:RNA polymerase sigma-70 factor (ECF subfamily)
MVTDERDAEFSAFVAARGAALIRTAYLLTGDHQAGEDLVQTALAKTYVAWPRIRAREAVESYVRRTMVTTHTSWWRRRWYGETPTEVLPDFAATADSSGQHAERDRLWRHLTLLSERQRAVVVLRFYEDLSEAQTAELLGCSRGAVKSHLSRALSRLREALSAEAEDGGDDDVAAADRVVHGMADRLEGEVR